MYCEDDLLSISGLQHLTFCKRRAGLVLLDSQWEENVFTAEGSIIHKNVDIPGLEVRNNIRYTRGLRIRSMKLGLIGGADLLEFRKVEEKSSNTIILGNVPGYWIPVPIEYKHGETRDETEYNIQLCAQAICMEEMFEVCINSGFIYYAGDRRRKEIAFSSELRNDTADAAIILHQIIDTKVLPPFEYTNKCHFCSLKDICMPTLSKVQTASAYFNKMVSQNMKG